MVLIILVQRSEGGALGLGISQDNFASTRSVGNLLTKLTGIVATLFIVSSISLVVLSRADLQETRSVIEQIEENNSGIQALSLFPKYVNVFDCIHIYAAQSISDAKVLHAAAIAAELLDNDEDGVIDDENVPELVL